MKGKLNLQTADEINKLTAHAVDLMHAAAKEDTTKANELLALALERLRQAIKIADRENQ